MVDQVEVRPDVFEEKRRLSIELAFGRAVRELRESRGLSQTQLAEGLATNGVRWFHQVTIGRLENAQRPTSIGEAYAIADFFGVDLHEMTRGQVSPDTFARADFTAAALAIRDEAERLGRLADSLMRRLGVPPVRRHTMIPRTTDRHMDRTDRSGHDS